MFYRSLLFPDLRMTLDANDEDGLREFCEALHPAVVAEVIDELEPSELWRVLVSCKPELQAEIFGFFEPRLQIAIVEVADRKRLSRLIEEMAPDDRVDVLERLDDEKVESLLPLMAQAERADIRKLLSYPDGSAGSIMTTEYASLSEEITVSQALDELRVQSPDSETIYYIYILDEGRRLDGIVSLRELIQAKRAATLSEIMHRDVLSVRVDDDEEFVARELARYDFLAIPVVDNLHRLVGIVTLDDALDVLEEEATEDAQMQAAIQPLDESYMTTPFFVLAQKRGVWLVILLAAAFLTAWVMQGYEELQQSYVWMVWFIPLVLASGGNAGSQSATLIIREMATTEMNSRDKYFILMRELRMAMTLGAGLMTLSFAVAICMVALPEAIVVSVTVLMMVIFGTSAGAILPIVFKRLGMDPALMSNPLIAALVDVLGVVIYFNTARALLGPVAMVIE
ncbi:MAG: magnesium transporter [Rhodopirellula sp.]|nr:magnesium transporter [Rhodopirellula sp.]